MKFDNITELAKNAGNKIASGAKDLNKLRKKANSEASIKIKTWGGFGTETIRQTVDGYYYLGSFTENPQLLEFVNFTFSGSKISSKTITNGKQKTKGKTGRVIGGSLVGAIAGPAGMVVGGIAGASGKKKGKSTSTSITTTTEKPGKATITFRDLETQQLKTLTTSLTQAEAENLRGWLG